MVVIVRFYEIGAVVGEGVVNLAFFCHGAGVFGGVVILAVKLAFHKHGLILLMRIADSLSVRVADYLPVLGDFDIGGLHTVKQRISC